MKYTIVESNTQNKGKKDIIVYGSSLNVEDKTEKVEDYIQNLTENTILVVIRAEDWDRDFSPWPASMPGDGTRRFTGGGKATLEWLQCCMIPEIREALMSRFSEGDQAPELHWYICGYSLAGLFALWAFYETTLFDGVAACSATLWFEGWRAYMETHQKEMLPKEMLPKEMLPKEIHQEDGRPELPNRSAACKAAYLSLGGRESRTSNPVMATIGTCYERQKKWMKEDPEIARVLFEWNPGGHFGDAQARVIKGIRWLIRSKN